ncbi:MAG: hypothetical protein FJZ62_00550 [Chlamydiae bacterium]|nr:hypothetical protein [Chlamydiota bacterium]
MSAFYKLIFYEKKFILSVMKILASLVLATSPFFASQLSVDKYLSPYTGADLFITSFEAQMEAEDSIKEFFQPEEDTWLTLGIAGTYRTATMLGWWVPLSLAEMVVQHEVFGHGYRVREFKKFGYDVLGYSFFDKSRLEGAIATTSYQAPNLESPFLENTIAFGGTEANTVLAQRMRENSFEKGFLDGRLSILYLFSNADLSDYIQLTAKLDDGTISEGNDIQAYLKTVNQMNPDSPVTIQQLKKFSHFCNFDPFLWGNQLSFFSYILFGKEFPLPVFQKGPFRFVPSISPNLTPFGPELILEQYFSIGTQPQRTYARFTPYNSRGSYGFGYKNLYLKSFENTHFGVILDGWYAPKIGKLSNNEIKFTKNTPMRPGAQALLTVRQSMELFANSKVGIDIGVKSQGYLIGTPVEQGLIARVSVELEF